MPGYYPAYLNLTGKRCVVVGGGDVAERKVKSLLECEALVTVISPKFSPGLRQLRDAGGIDAVSRQYRPGDLADAFLAVAATDQRSINAQVAAEARQSGKLVNVVDDLDGGDFIVPSVVRRGDLVVSISTGGRSPALSRKLRLDLERLLAPEYESLLDLMAEVREETKSSGLGVDPAAWQPGITPELLELLKGGLVEQAKAKLVSALARKDAGAES